MERCSNCNAPVRTGSKYCTTCGVRLPDAQAGAQSNSSRSPFSSTSSKSERPETGRFSPQAQSGTARDDGQPVVPADAWSGWSGSTGAAPEPAETVSEPVSVPADQELEIETSWGNWPATSEEGAVQDEAVETIVMPDREDEEAPIFGDDAIPMPAGSDESTAATAAGMGAMGADGEQTSTALTRARALLDELAAILPDAVTTGGGTIDGQSVANALAAVRAGGPDSGTVSALREAVATAQGGTKDLMAAVEVMGRIESISLVLEAYDRLAAATDMAISQLRGQD